MIESPVLAGSAAVPAATLEMGETPAFPAKTGSYGRMQMKTALISSLIASLCIIGAAIAAPPDNVLDHGKEVYAVQKCALCHSIAGIGGKKMALDGVGSRLSSEDIKKWIRTPKQMKPATIMKSYPNLPEKDLNDLTAFLMSLR
jgi:mono/diheme cytochrome c family protein